MKGNVSFFPSVESLCHVYDPHQEILVLFFPANVCVAFSRFLVLFTCLFFSLLSWREPGGKLYTVPIIHFHIPGSSSSSSIWLGVNGGWVISMSSTKHRYRHLQTGPWRGVKSTVRRFLSENQRVRAPVQGWGWQRGVKTGEGGTGDSGPLGGSCRHFLRDASPLLATLIKTNCCFYLKGSSLPWRQMPTFCLNEQREHDKHV